MRIALAQIVSSPEPTDNLLAVDRETRVAADAGAQLVIFPEATMCCFGTRLDTVAEPLDGPWADGVRRIAERAGITVVVGMFTPSGDGRVRNTLLATGGGVSSSYDKIHLFDAFGFAESDTVAPGRDLVTIVVDGTTVGLATCYDLRFPGLFQRLGDRGAQLVAVPASWGSGPGKRTQWDVLVRARAMDSTTFVAACDQADPRTVGRDPGNTPTGIGASAVAGPLGELVDQLGPQPGMLVVEIDPTAADRARAAVPVLANRRF
jgi:predicted amidohydrolase